MLLVACNWSLLLNASTSSGCLAYPYGIANQTNAFWKATCPNSVLILQRVLSHMACWDVPELGSAVVSVSWLCTPLSMLCLAWP